MAELDQSIQSILRLVPLWDEAVWGALQTKEFGVAETELRYVLRGGLADEDWRYADWWGMFSGAEPMRGDLDQETWRTRVKPLIAWAIINEASPRQLGELYAGLSAERRQEVHGLLLDAIPGDTPAEKLANAKAKRPGIYVFYLTNPAGLFIAPQDRGLLNANNRARYETLPEALRGAFFSADVREVLAGIAAQNHLPEDKIPGLAEALGKVLLGFVHGEDLDKEIQSCTNLDPRIAKELAAALQSKVLGALHGELEKVYAPAAVPVRVEEISQSAEVAAPPKPVILQTAPAPVPVPVAAAKPFADLNPPPSKNKSALAPLAPAASTVAVSAAPQAKLAAVPPPPRPAPATPVFIQTKTEIRPLTPQKDFKLQVSAPAPAFRPVSAPAAPKAARVELGIPKAPPVPKTAPAAEGSANRVVHYTQWKTPLTPPLTSPVPGGVAPISLANLAANKAVSMPEAYKPPAIVTPQAKLAAVPPPPRPAAAKPLEASPVEAPVAPVKPLDTLLARLAPVPAAPTLKPAKVVDYPVPAAEVSAPKPPMPPPKA